jgi:hypothetical protein
MKLTKSDDLKWHIKQWQEARYSINSDMKRMMYHAKEIKRLQDEKLDATSKDA